MVKMSATLVLMLAIVGCGPKSPSVKEKPQPRYQDGPYYFKDAQKVDNETFGPPMYRLENDEVICYSGGSQQGLQCKWKTNQ